MSFVSSVDGVDCRDNETNAGGKAVHDIIIYTVIETVNNIDVVLQSNLSLRSIEPRQDTKWYKCISYISAYYTTSHYPTRHGTSV
jgi:hypothetical protein